MKTTEQLILSKFLGDLEDLFSSRCESLKEICTDFCHNTGYSINHIERFAACICSSDFNEIKELILIEMCGHPAIYGNPSEMSFKVNPRSRRLN